MHVTRVSVLAADGLVRPPGPVPYRRPFVTVSCGKEVSRTTSPVSSTSPVWDEVFHFFTSPPEAAAVDTAPASPSRAPSAPSPRQPALSPARGSSRSLSPYFQSSMSLLGAPSRPRPPTQLSVRLYDDATSPPSFLGDAVVPITVGNDLHACPTPVTVNLMVRSSAFSSWGVPASL